ncbi:MAG: NAD(P)H-dependent oxidoreductase [bacterium]|nr:NAD(P)H-dependent oxidoreductase [bacterium]MDZ4231325.1 NAD(P)H-dependent oxidoreductase [Patescibacteria group bacterium]
MIKLVAVAGSLRQDSFNRKALQNALSFVEGEDIEIQKLDLETLDLPVFNEDLETKVPESVRELQRTIAKADLILIATPEYNRSVPGGLKNAIDWVSRTGSVPLTDKVVVLLGASTGGFGTVRAQIHLRQILMALGAFIIPQPEIHISYAAEAFNEDGSLKDEALKEKLKSLIQAGVNLVRKLRA